MNHCYDNYRKQKIICQRIEQQQLCHQRIHQRWRECMTMCLNKQRRVSGCARVNKDASAAALE